MSKPIDTGKIVALHAVWRDNALWMVNTVVPPAGPDPKKPDPDAGQVTAHWYKIDTSNLASLKLAEHGNVGGEDFYKGLYTFFPAIMADSAGNMAIGFAGSDANHFASAYYTGRSKADTASTVRATKVLRRGKDFYVRTDGIGRNRWGDYSGLALDPAATTTFWVFNEYAEDPGIKNPKDEDGLWGTTWGSFSFANVAGPASISGTKFHDFNGDSVRQTTEPALAGWTIFLDADDDGILDAWETRVVTDAAGNYTFDGLAPGLYQVREVLQPGWSQSEPPGGVYTIDLLPGDTAPNRDFGNTRLDSITGTKFHDLDGNGIQHPTEPGLGGWTIFLDANGNARLDAGEPRTSTDPSGRYAFIGLAPGSYTVREVLQAGWLATTPAVRKVTLVAGQSISEIDFGNARPGSVSGVVFHDQDRSGTRDSGEPGLRNWTIYLDRDNDGAFEPNVTAQSSSGNPTPIPDGGTFTSSLSVSGRSGTLSDVDVEVFVTHPFDADLDVFLISASRTRVELFTGVGASGKNFTSTRLDDQASTAITAGSAPFAGSFRPEGVLADLAGEDPNGTWTLEITDRTTGNTGRLIRWSLFLNTGDLSTRTDASGRYSFPNLAPGSYVVREVVPNGWVQTFPASGLHPVTLSSSADVTGKDFGNVRHQAGSSSAGTGSPPAQQPLGGGTVVFTLLGPVKEPQVAEDSNPAARRGAPTTSTRTAATTEATARDRIFTLVGQGPPLALLGASQDALGWPDQWWAALARQEPWLLDRVFSV